MRRLLFFIAILLYSTVGSATGQLADVNLEEAISAAERLPGAGMPSDMAARVYYVVARSAIVYKEMGGENPYVRLGFREAVYVQQEEGAWSLIQTQDGARGYVESSALSNVWIRVSKRKQTLYLYRGTTLVKEIPADFGYNAFADKRQQGGTGNPDDWRTPDGVFSVVRKNPYSKFYKAFVLNYPTAEDAERGYKEGLISSGQRDAIMNAEADFRVPPMGTSLGGMIEIHGDGTGARTNWTQGCIAIHNDEMDKIWDWVQEGTPVIVER